MSIRDGKDKFYRTLELDDDSKAILKWYRKNRKSIENVDNEEKEEKES